MAQTALTTTTAVQTALASLLLRMRGQSHDYQGLGHAEPYGDSEAAWDDAGDLMYEAQSEHETAQDDAAEARGELCETYAELTGRALFEAALRIELSRETARLARVQAHEREAREALALWSGEAKKTREGLAMARKALA